MIRWQYYSIIYILSILVITQKSERSNWIKLYTIGKTSPNFTNKRFKDQVTTRTVRITILHKLAKPYNIIACLNYSNTFAYVKG